MRSTLQLLAALCLTLLLGLSGCTEGPDQPAPGTSTGSANDTGAPLRLLTLRHPAGADYLPRSGLPESAELELAHAYAEHAGRKAEVVFVDALEDLLPALVAGEGDIALANLTATERRREKVAFTSPVTFTREVVVARAGEAPTERQDLGGRQVAVKRASAFRQTLEQVRERRFQPAFEIVDLPPELSDEAVLEAVAAGAYDLTVLDSNTARALLAGRDDLTVAFSLSGVRPIAWAVPRSDDALLADLNAFLAEHHLLPTDTERRTGDLAQIQEFGVLRVAMRNNAATYFLWRGELMGFEYELIKRFADRHDLRVEVVVPPRRDDLLELVRNGRADLASASLTITDAREQELAFSRPYNYVSELVVTRADDRLQSLQELEGRTIVVRRSSSYWHSVQALREQGIDVALEPAPENLETETIIAKVASGEYDLTVADSHIVDIELTWRDDVRSAFALGEPRPHGWALREDNPKLLAAVDAFLEKEYRGLFYNVTYKRYFENPKRIVEYAEGRTDRGGGQLSPFDALVRQYARRYGFDWRLVVAQMFQESRFDPAAKSWAGARGLMQVLPRTAKEFGLGDLREPEEGIHAGVKYLDWLRKRFEPDLDVANRTWFALAAYNAGVGHVRDARKLAQQKGWNPDLWFGNVERAMLLLSQKQYAREAQYGYVRGTEPVQYVREIRDRYTAYAKLSGE